MTCKCAICKNCRGEITDQELKKSLESDIKRFNKILSDKASSKENFRNAEINKDEAEYMIIEIENREK